jgi:hypothetical protein
MKNFKILLLVIISLCFSNVLKAQNDEFTVFSKKGDVQVQKGGKGASVSLKVGEKLLSKDKITINTGTMVTLYNTKLKKSIELKKAGSYNVNTLAADLQKKKGYSDRFKDYVLTEMTASNNLFSSGQDDNMNTMGSVDRQINIGGTENKLESLTGADKDVSFAVTVLADELAESNSNMIQAKLPRSSYVADKDIEFSWYERKSSGVYEFRIVDITDKVIYSKKLHNTFLTVNLDEAKLEKGKTYYWYVVDGDMKSNQYSISRLTDSETASIVSLISDINYDDMSPLDKLNLATFYEDRNIMNRAIKIYEEVLKDYPDSQEFKRLYSRYLVRIGLFTEATNLSKTETNK